VVASNSGGLEEAKRGTGYVIPVQTIERYEPVFDEHSMPKPVLPENDVAPWVAALRELSPRDTPFAARSFVHDVRTAPCLRASFARIRLRADAPAQPATVRAGD